MPVFSHLLLNYNNAAKLPRALEAILREAASADEIIVVDDASHDDSVQVIETFKERDSRIVLLRNAENRGIIESSRRALDVSSGKYVGLRASDDHVLPGMAQAARRLAEAYPHAGVLAQEAVVLRADGAQWRYQFGMRTREGYISGRDLSRVLRLHYFWIAMSGAFIRRDRLLEAGGWRVDLDWMADWFSAYAVALHHGVAYASQPGVMIFEDMESFGKRGAREALRRDRAYAAFFDTLKLDEFHGLRSKFLSVPQLVLSGLGGDVVDFLRGQKRDTDFMRRLIWRRRLLPVTARLAAFISSRRRV